MATTPNYGWVTPAPTDFVTDLPADFEIFADAVDADLSGLLGGTTGQVLAKDSNDDHDFSWQTSSGLSSANYTLLNSGGTALTGAQTITVSGISDKESIFLFVEGASTASSGSYIGIRLNGVTTGYAEFYGLVAGTSTYSIDIVQGVGLTNSAYLELGRVSTNTGSTLAGSAQIVGCKTTGQKIITSQSGVLANTGNNHRHQTTGGHLDTTAITSVSLFSSAGNFDAGTLYVYATA
jgi:hypothetical protein